MSDGNPDKYRLDPAGRAHARVSNARLTELDGGFAVTGKAISTARLSVAPMMDWTDRHCRYFHRLLSRETLLYTEMVTAPALVRGGALHLLDYNPEEHPVALQLGGSDPEELAQAARLGADAGYDEINLNCGCPSDRVQSGTFGAVLMKEPARVAECVSAMRASVDVDVTVKCRIGVDDQQPQEVLPDFLTQIRAAGCMRVTIHARKAWLQGLSPKENRDIPPLDYDLVHRMKADFPDMHISINGGITSLDHAQAHLEAGLDGVMIGRAAYHQPTDILAQADMRIYQTGAAVDPIEVVQDMVPYVERHLANGGRLHQITRHMLGLFAGRPGARAWRRALSEGAVHDGAGPEVMLRALEQVAPLAEV
ncbi:MAG: tRNA dihydrouridine(20/20a) synthase DusA [Pseudomonadota bacterium]